MLEKPSGGLRVKNKNVLNLVRGGMLPLDLNGDINEGQPFFFDIVTLQEFAVVDSGDITRFLLDFWRLVY